MVKRCINIDWLEVFCEEDLQLFPCNAEYYKKQNWKVRKRAYGTPQYREMFELLTHEGEPFIEIRRNPYSVKTEGGIFNPNSCHIRLANPTCYLEDPIGIMRTFLLKNRIKMIGISRIDICLDFEHFDNNDNPQIFLDQYLKGIYTKINQSNISAHGKDTWQARIWNSLSWGSEKSMIRTKMYLKSQELKETKDKPYIRAAWKEAGLITADSLQGITQKIWRVEFSIHSEAKSFLVINDETQAKTKRKHIPNNLNCYDTKEKLLSIFRGLAEHYFHFKVYEEGKRKDRCKDKILWKWSKDIEIAKAQRKITNPDKSRTDKIMLNQLKKIYENKENLSWVRASAKLTAEIIMGNWVKHKYEHSIQEMQNFLDYTVDYFIQRESDPALAFELEQREKIIQNMKKMKERYTQKEMQEDPTFANAKQILKEALHNENGTKRELMQKINRYYIKIAGYINAQKLLEQVIRYYPKAKTGADVIKNIDEYYKKMTSSGTEEEII